MPARYPIIVLVLVIPLSAAVLGKEAAAVSPLWGKLANPAFENHRIRTTLFFSGQASDGSNPYRIADPPGSRLFLYTEHPADDRHLQWSDSAANRDFAVSQMVDAGINVVTMSSWGESFLDSQPRPPWAVFAPMQTSPASHEELFTAAVDQPLLVTPFIESRGDWSLRQEFPNPQGSVAPGAVSQVVDLVNRFLLNDEHPEWADQWTRVYDRNGEQRYAVAFIHASSDQLAEPEHAAYAQGFDALADEVFAQTGVKVGFFLDVLARDSFAPGNFKPTPEETGPELFNTASILGLQNFLPEIWAGVPHETARLNWKRDFSSRWAATGIPFLIDVAPGYDAHIVFPDSVQYGHNAAWIDGMTALVEDFGEHGLVYNSWNGYTEAMLAVESIERGDAYFQWLQGLTKIHEPARWVGNLGNWSLGDNWSPHVPIAERRTILDNGGTAQLNSVAAARLVDVGTVPGMGGTVDISSGAALTIHDGGFRLGLIDGGQGNLVMTGGSVDVVGGFNMFLVGDHGHGTATVSGGAITARTFGIALQPTSTGHVEISGDAVITTTGDRFVMAAIRDATTGQQPTASLTMTGGAINVSPGVTGIPDFVVAFDGVAQLDMSGGTIDVAGNFVTAVAGAAEEAPSSHATINHSGGTIHAERMFLAERGQTEYYLSGSGEINVARRLVLGWLAPGGVGADGTFTQTGGTVNANLSGAAVADAGMLIGERGHGAYHLDAGVLNVNQTLWLGQWETATAQMNVTGGQANIALDVGLSLRGDATLTHSGGVMNIGRSLFISNGNLSSTATGSYEISGGELHVDADLVVGFFNGNGRLSVIGGEGQISVGNNYFQDPAARLFVQPDAAGQLSVIDVAGNALFWAGTTLEASFDDFSFSPGQSWDVLAAATIDDQGLGVIAPAGIDWRIVSGASGEILQLFVPGLPGDFNGDGVVDAADYAVWRDGLGGPFDEGDYHVWKQNFGAANDSASGFASNAAVPEPGNLVLLLLAAATGAMARRP